MPRSAATPKASDPLGWRRRSTVAWREHVNQALAVLHTAREPDEAMAAVGDASMWRNMVEAAIAQHVD